MKKNTKHYPGKWYLPDSDIKLNGELLGIDNDKAKKILIDQQKWMFISPWY